jgi:hypothetical protein
MVEQPEFDDVWQQLVARAWSHPAFKAKLLADPAVVLKTNGLTVPAGVTVKVLENTDAVLNLVLPVKPVAEELSEEELHKAAGGRQNMVYDSDQGPNHDIGRLTGDCDPNDDRYT